MMNGYDTDMLFIDNLVYDPVVTTWYLAYSGYFKLGDYSTNEGVLF